jgi:glutamate synthase (NADPH/NADH) small chain
VADPRGFLKVRDRELPANRPVPVRLRDYRDVVAERTRDAEDIGTLQRQAGRCMDCGIPFCHSGCPLGNLIPEWNDLVWTGQWGEASDRLHATNNFPEFTGKICPAPCETACVLGINNPPVTIKNVEVSIVDEAFARGLVTPQVPFFLTGHTVAVVGSGPAGLAAAQQLTRAGHTVAVFRFVVGVCSRSRGDKRSEAGWFGSNARFLFAARGVVAAWQGSVLAVSRQSAVSSCCTPRLFCRGRIFASCNNTVV